MKNGRTHLAYKAEHAVDLPSEAIVSAHVTNADRGATAPAGRRAWCWRGSNATGCQSCALKKESLTHVESLVRSS